MVEIRRTIRSPSIIVFSELFILRICCH